MKLDKLAEGMCGGKREEEEGIHDFEKPKGLPPVERRVPIGQGREGEVLAYKMAEALRAPEYGWHAQAGIGEGGIWFVNIRINPQES